MFDVGFSEVLVIALVALVVLGPEKLPKAARMVGTFMRKARRSFDSLKMEVERELEAEDLKRQLASLPSVNQLADDVLGDIRKPLQQAQSNFQAAVDDIGAAIKGATTRVTASADDQAAPNSTDGDAPIDHVSTERAPCAVEKHDTPEATLGATSDKNTISARNP